ncbi:hypothetical protein HYT58_02755 [Candidatus Woesearchaeota archaeon]|nr:hypothetical protein [Candidatus Woesearchaeota archaeon]
MKKITAFILILMLIFFVVGCSKGAPGKQAETKTQSSGQTAIDEDVQDLDEVDKDVGDAGLDETEQGLDLGL